MVYGTQITIVNGVYKPTYNWGAPQTVDGHAMLFLHMFASEFYRHIYTRTQTHIWETTTTIATLLE